MRTKEKLSITLSKSLIKDLDRISEARGARSRSELIEDILNELLEKHKIRKAVIVWKTHHIVGGVPTILAKVGKKTNIEYVVEKLAGFGIKEILIGGEGYFREFFSLLGDASAFGVKISYPPATKHLGNAGAIKSNQQF